MNECSEYTRLLAQAYSKLADDYTAMWKREDAARAEIQKLEELFEKWMAEATRQSERADAAEARILKLHRELDAEIAEKTARIIEESNRAEDAEARVKELEAHLASERITRDAVIQQGLELEARLHACAFNRDMNGECCVCGSVDEKIVAAQREADERHAARQQGGAK